MSERRLYLDRGPGESRAVVTLDDQPERLLIRRDVDTARLLAGARFIGRVRRVEPAIATAFIDLGEGEEGVVSYRPEARPLEGAALEVEVRSEPRRGKLAALRVTGPGEGRPRLLSAAPDLMDQLHAFARDVAVIEGPEARRVADEAQAEALAIFHTLPGGGRIAIEPTRALTAIDVDLGQRKGVEAKRVTRQANLAALAATSRLLRLKSLGGLVVFDLAGRGHDGHALLAAARVAFAPDNPGVAFGPISRFGTLELTIPRRSAPISDRLCRPDGAISDETLALMGLRRLEDEASVQPGARFEVRLSPDVAKAARIPAETLALRIGARFTILADGKLARDRVELATL